MLEEKVGDSGGRRDRTRAIWRAGRPSRAWRPSLALEQPAAAPGARAAGQRRARRHRPPRKLARSAPRPRLRPA
jgi:hypothetical protein